MSIETPHLVMDPMTFRASVRREVARVGQAGGFLSLALLGARQTSEGNEALRERMSRAADRLRAHTRSDDLLTCRGTTLAVMMKATTAVQAQAAARRLLALARQQDNGLLASDPESAGIATVFGDVEGGSEALFAAAEEALREAKPGTAQVSAILDGRPRVLVVDDDTAFAEALADRVSEQGWQAHPCSHPIDALARLKSDSYNALFVDLMMPGYSGVDILRQSLATHPRRPAVLMSGMDDQHDAVLDALTLGPVTFLRKPMAAAEVDGALRMFRELLPGPQVRA
jgi:CheY-like chemotaxis protein